MKYLLLLCAAAFGFSGLNYAETPPPLEAYGKLPFTSSAEISPDGTKVVVIANLNGKTSLVVFEVGGKIIKQVGIESIKARSVSFYDDDHVILNVSETTTTRGFRGEYEFSGAYAINIETGKTSQLLRNTKDLFPAQSGLGRIVGRAKKDGEALMPAYIGSAYSPPSNNLMKVNLKTGRGRTLQRGNRDTIDWFTDGKGGALVRETYSNDKNRYRVEHRVSGKWKTIYERKNVDIPPLSIHGVLPDMSGLVFVRAAEDNDSFDQLMKLGFDGEITGPILEKAEKEIDAIYTDVNRVIVGVRYSGNIPEYDFIDKDLTISIEQITAKLPNATVYLDSWSDDRSHVLYRVYEPSIGDIWLIHDVTADSLGMVANNRSDIPASALGTISSIEYKARDGLTIPAIVTLPHGVYVEDQNNLPLIVMPHGGPSAYDRLDFDWMAQFFASRGYVVLQPNFRGSTGFGSDFLNAGRGEWGGKMQDDVTDGVEALASAGVIDKDRVCIVGASYGGYAALAGAVYTPNLYKCVIAIAPVSDLQLMLSNTKRDRGRTHWVLDYWEGLMADGDASRDKLKAISPANFAENVTAPILLLHGDDDTVVPIAQSRKMERALKREGREVKFVRLKGEDHWLSVAETRMQLLIEMDAFVAEHLPIE